MLSATESGELIYKEYKGLNEEWREWIQEREKKEKNESDIKRK